MADENTLRRYRANDRDGHDDGRASRDHTNNDPLAELARLIGQSDPFATVERATPRGGERRDPSHVVMGTPGAALRRRDAAPAYSAPVQPDYEAQHHDDMRTPHFPPSTVPRHDYMASSADLPADPYSDPHDQLFVQDRSYEDGSYGDDGQFDHDQPEAHYQAVGAGQENYQEAYYEDEAPMGPQDEEMYDDAPNTSRRGGLLTVVTLVGCAMFGTAGAYAYRTYYVGGAPANPPIIVADKTPAKIVPPTDTQSSKVIQDRVGDQGNNERMVSHEEQPLDLPSPGTQSSPRVVLPAPVTPMPSTQAAFPPPPTQSTVTMPPARATAQRTAPGGEPKRVHTVTIRPDQADDAGNPADVGPTGSAPAPRAANSRALAAQSRTAPLSLTPGAQSPASATASARSNQDMRLASAPSNAGTGGYMVQISSQRTEAEAHASFRAMQAKYRNVLGGHEGTVRRADLGSKGTYYRAMVGPFASAGEAGQLCSQLKSAGGQCIIQRN